MSDTCATHRSRVPRRSSGRIKGGATTVEDERGPGLDFNLCFVCGSRPWGAAALLLCLFICLLNFFKCSPVPPPSSRSTNFVTLVPKPGRKEGHAVRRSPRCWGDRGAEEVGQHGEAETASGCPRRWCWNDRRSGGTEGSLPCSWVEEGWLPSKRERRSRRRSPGGRSLLPSAMSGEEQGTGDSLPATLDRRSHRRPPGGGGALGRPPKMSSTIAWHREWEPLSWLRTERQRVREPDQDFFFSFPLSPLSSLSLLILPSPFLSPRLSLPPGTPRPPWRAPLGGGGGVERSLEGTPRPARGDGGMWRVGRGREPWERSEAGGVNDNERHLRHSPVSSPTEELRKDKRRSDDSGRRERTRPGF